MIMSPKKYVKTIWWLCKNFLTLSRDPQELPMKSKQPPAIYFSRKGHRWDHCHVELLQGSITRRYAISYPPKGVTQTASKRGIVKKNAVFIRLMLFFGDPNLHLATLFIHGQVVEAFVMPLDMFGTSAKCPSPVYSLSWFDCASWIAGGIHQNQLVIQVQNCSTTWTSYPLVMTNIAIENGHL